MYWSKKKNVEMSNDDDDAGGLAKRKIIHDQNMVVVDCANAKEGSMRCTTEKMQYAIWRNRAK